MSSTPIAPAVPAPRERRASEPAATGRRGWLAVAVLALLGAVATADRNILPLLVHPLQRDLGIGDFGTGLLLGPAFAASYVICSVPVGLAIDRYSRRLAVFFGVLVWTVATVACGFVASFSMLLAMRVLVGGGEASISPAAHSLLGDLFPPERRTLPYSLYQAGQTVGAGGALLAAGALLGWFSAHAAGGTWHGLTDWQFVFLVVGAPGVVLALAAFLLPEPRRSVTRGRASAPVAMRRYLETHGAIFALVCLIISCSVTVTIAQTAWTAEYLRRTLGWAPQRIGTTLGAIHLVLPLTGHLLSGWISDRWARAGRTDAPLRAYLAMTAVALPFVVMLYLTRDDTVFVICAAAYALLVMPSVALGAAAVQRFTPGPARGRAAAIFLAVINLAGSAVGPTLTGALTQFGFGDPAKLGLALAWVSSVGVAAIVLLSLVALPMLRAAVRIEQSAEAEQSAGAPQPQEPANPSDGALP